MSDAVAPKKDVMTEPWCCLVCKSKFRFGKVVMREREFRAEETVTRDFLFALGTREKAEDMMIDR